MQLLWGLAVRDYALVGPISFAVGWQEPMQESVLLANKAVRNRPKGQKVCGGGNKHQALLPGVEKPRTIMGVIFTFVIGPHSTDSRSVCSMGVKGRMMFNTPGLAEVYAWPTGCSITSYTFPRIVNLVCIILLL